MGKKRILAGMAAVALCFALVPFARDWFDPIDSLWNPTKDCFPLDEQFSRGMMFLKRRHFAERNRRKAEEWLLASANQGYADAQFQLGILCEEGSASDPAEVRKWFEAAAAQGHPEAMARVKEIERKRRIEEAKAQAEFERQKREAEERARLEAERKKREAEERARLEAERQKREAEERTRLEAERKKHEAEEAERQKRESILAKGAGKRAGDRKTMRIGSQNIAFRWCPATTSDEWKKISGGNPYFRMGSHSGERGRNNDETPVSVALSHGFWMGETEVTQGLWKEIMGGTLLDQARKALQDDTQYNFGGKMQTIREWFGGKNRDSDPQGICADMDDLVPVYFVNWDEAKGFCEKLEIRLRVAGMLPEGYGVRLPTEAEWEYACRAGTKTALPSGKDISVLGANNAPNLNEIAWYGGNSSVGFQGRGWDTENWKEKQFPGGIAGPRRVGTKAANNWGIRDMIGNVWEWCSDWYGSYPVKAATDPSGHLSGSSRVNRGGAWNVYANWCRSASRSCDNPRIRNWNIGFRIVLVSVQ